MWEAESPASLLGSEGKDLFGAYRLVKEYGIFPVAGGQADQTALFLQAVHFCDTIHTVFAERKGGKETDQARAQGRLQKLMGG